MAEKYNPTEYNPSSISSSFDSESPFDSSLSQKSEEALDPAALLGLQDFTKSVQSAVGVDQIPSTQSSAFDSEQSNHQWYLDFFELAL